MATGVCVKAPLVSPGVHSVANSEALIFDDLGGCRLDVSLGREPPTVLITFLTHESDPRQLRCMAEQEMRGVAGLMKIGHGIKGQFYGDHTSNSATVVLMNADPSADKGLADALLRVYKQALHTPTLPVYQKLVHDVLFLPLGHTLRYEGRVGEGCA